ncbi:MAG: adenylate/guanylate cyclase domain-containing protein [Spirochaetaceae bacterium]|jgi:adenylate cyclase|nr:adenylate/guanylate cyclase domain-containing protein [Spirochaetaceae bacterium]
MKASLGKSIALVASIVLLVSLLLVTALVYLLAGLGVEENARNNNVTVNRLSAWAAMNAVNEINGQKDEINEGLSELFTGGANQSVLVSNYKAVAENEDPVMTVLKAAILIVDSNADLGNFTASTVVSTSSTTATPPVVEPVETTYLVTSIPKNVVFEGVAATARRNLYIALGIWALAMLMLRFFSRSITTPLEKLHEATREIEDGNYNIKLASKNKDETGLLTRNVQSMSTTLLNFERLTNKELSRLARQGKLSLGGEEKTATIFFSDIRGFTGISEKLEAEEVVHFLNDYLDRMVRCVLASGGAIDKFIGDAVFAHWGAVPSPTPPPEDMDADAFNALSACRTALLMRAALACFNAGRSGDNTEPIIKIGMGINTGRVAAGQIGSDERLMFTIIGDAVTLTDRTEAFNKTFGTQILVTENTYKLVEKYFLFEEMPSIIEKPGLNSSNKIRMYALVNVIDKKEYVWLVKTLSSLPNIDIDRAEKYVGPWGPRSLAELRALIEIPKPDLSKIDTANEEIKYRLLNDDNIRREKHANGKKAVKK